MKICFECKNCLKRYLVDPGLVGKKVNCKNCGAQIVVPGADSPEEFSEVLEANGAIGGEEFLKKTKDFIGAMLASANQKTNREWQRIYEAERRLAEKQLSLDEKVKAIENLWERIKREEERNRLEKERLEEQRRESQNILEMKEQLDKELAKLKDENDQLREAHRQIEERYDKLEQTERGLVQSILELKSQKSRLNDELNKRVEEVRYLNEKINRLKEQLNQAHEKGKNEMTERACTHQSDDDGHQLIHNSSVGKQSLSPNTTPRSKVRTRKPEHRGGGNFLQPKRNKKSGRLIINEPVNNLEKCEIICFKRARQWIVAIEIPEKMAMEPDITLHQNSATLSRLENDDNLWGLKDASGELLIEWSGKNIRIKLGDYLIFKLAGENDDYGRLVARPSYGSYLLLIPEGGVRNEDSAIGASIAPEPTSIDGYQAHFFDLEKGDNTPIAFLTHDKKPVRIKQKTSSFELVGACLNDAEAKMGPLFAKELPRIRAKNIEAWQDIKTIVVGEEGLGRGKWRRHFRPNPEMEEQELPPELIETDRGWYFLRFYDEKDELVESMDFRFIRNLYGINIHRLPPIPYDYEYPPSTVEFIHNKECKIEPFDSKAAELEILYGERKTVVNIPSDPKLDKTKWVATPEQKKPVPITILVERVWWAIADEGFEPSDWSCKLLSTKREDFAATSNKALWIRFPRKRWIKSLLAGFDHTKAKTYVLKVTDHAAAIPLCDFCNSEVFESIGVSSFSVWFSHATKDYEVTPLNLDINWRCKHCNFLTDTEADFYSHIEKSHLGQFFDFLTYEEMRVYLPSLPLKIYKCAHCSSYVKTDDPSNPTSAIYDHLIKHHPRKKHGFEVISDVDEIRKNVSLNLPTIHKCTFCDSHLEEVSNRALVEHLRLHWTSLCEVL